MPIERLSALCTCASLLLCVGCAAPQPVSLAPPPAEPGNMVVLLPGADGKVGRLTVSNRAGSRTLDQAGSSTRILNADTIPTEPATLGAAELDATFGAALAAQPPTPRHFILYFDQGSTDLTQASRSEFPAIVAAVREYASVDTSVVGHSDTAGDARANLALSLRRAMAVGGLLAAEGIDPGALDITSHGESNLLIPTGDNAPEPRNRRVEVTVR